MITKFDLIVFDWDGTLADSIDWIVDCIIHSASQHGLPIPSEQACKDIIGLSLPQAMQALFPVLHKDDETKMLLSYRERYLAKKATPDDLFKEALPTLLTLQSMGKTLAVATGKGRAGLDRVLDGTQTRSFFNQLRCADTMESKPSPHMLFDIMDATNTRPENTLMIGDSTLDLIMAKNAGVESIGISTGAHSHDTLIKHASMGCLNNLTELFKDD